MSEALVTLLADALPRSAPAYAVGFTAEERADIERVVGSDVTFVDGPDDVDGARDVVVAGHAWESVFADRAATFEERLALLDACLQPGGSLAIAMPNAHSTADLLAPAPRSVGTADAHALAYDETRPTGPRGLRAALGRHGHPAVNVHEIYGGAKGWCIVGDDAADLAQRADFVLGAVSRALEAAAGDDTLLAPEVLVRRLAAAGALATAATSYVALVGGRGRALYVETHGAVEWFDGSAQDARWAAGGTHADAERPVDIPVARNVETQLLASVAANDAATFRKLAEQIGSWVATSPQLDGRHDLDLRSVLLGGGEPLLVPSMARATAHDVVTDPADVDRPLVLTRAWRRFVARARLLEPDMPWPRTLSDDELLGIWLSMSGIAEDEIPGLLAATAADETRSRDSRSANAVSDPLSRQWERAEASERITALEDEIAALHATLRARDEELAIRARVIRSLRMQTLTASRNRDKMAQANADIKNSAAFRLANQFRRAALVTRPKKLVTSVGKAADKRVRALRRAG